MALKFKYKTREEIPGDALVHYVERDGGWVLDVDGAVEKASVEEFRPSPPRVSDPRRDVRSAQRGPPKGGE